MYNPTHTKLIEDIQATLKDLQAYKKPLRNCDAKLLEECLHPLRRRLGIIFEVIEQKDGERR